MEHTYFNIDNSGVCQVQAPLLRVQETVKAVCSAEGQP